jgi:hypothetical protein
MTQKQYRTAQGRLVDIGALQLKNEEVRAVGNVPVNARGDLIDSNNRPIDTKNQQVSRQYNKQVSRNVSNSQVYSSQQNQKIQQAKAEADIPAPPEDFENDFIKPAEDSSAPVGLAGAIARARQVTQEPLKTARQVAQMNNLKKI